jgi:hypothetical protein
MPPVTSGAHCVGIGCDHGDASLTTATAFPSLRARRRAALRRSGHVAEKRGLRADSFSRAGRHSAL